MNFIRTLSTEYDTLSIVGMAKNAGKTTALNYLIEDAMDEGIALGITSTGRDGESTDVVTGTDKPKVYLDAGSIVSTTTGLYNMAEAGLEILKRTPFQTPLGQVLLCRVRESGYVQIAGPVNTNAHKEMYSDMLEMGAELVLIDGAIDRRSIAAPNASDAMILSTGAVISRSIKKIVEETAHIVGLYRMPLFENSEARALLCRDEFRERIVVLSGDNTTPLELKTGLAAGRYLDDAITENTSTVYIPGALTPSVITDIHPRKFKDTEFVLKDPTKIFMGPSQWQQYRKKGLRVSVMSNITIAGITVNPTSPDGYRFDSNLLCDAVRTAIPDIPVVDVRM